MIKHSDVLNQQLLTIEQAKSYMKCSHVFLWKRRKEGKIQTVHAGKKVLLPKASIDAYLELNKVKLIQQTAIPNTSKASTNG